MQKPTVTWWPLVFSPFIAFLFLDPYQHRAGWSVWALTATGVLLFLTLYGVGLRYWYRRPVALAAVGGIAILGLVFAPSNSAAAMFIIFATSLVPYAVRGAIALAAMCIGLILLGVGVESWLLHLNYVFWAYSAGYALVLGTGNTYAARHAFATEGLAKTDERERIARDLHDVLGHTLSLVILKAELAGKLVQRDPVRARAEIADVERISRAALAEVRQTISGYAVDDLKAELERAKSTLAVAGVAAECHVTPVRLTRDEESVVALALREAVTNIVRHARASRCRIELRTADAMLRLAVHDGGRGGSHAEGQGLRGMRTRVEAFGGTLAVDGRAGTRLTVTLPLTAPQHA